MLLPDGEREHAVFSPAAWWETVWLQKVGSHLFAMTTKDHSYLWEEESADWVLVKLDADGTDPERYVVANIRTKQALLMEDEPEHELVVEKMLEHGCRVISPAEFAQLTSS